MKRWGLVFVGLTACYGDAEFRPAKDAHDLPSTTRAVKHHRYIAEAYLCSR